MTSSDTIRLDARYYLNPCLEDYVTDSIPPEPLQILRMLFQEWPHRKLVETFEDFCEAAVAPALCWKRSTDELLQFTNALEKLLVVNYLLYRKMPTDEPHKNELKTLFHKFPLHEWKSILHGWRLAAVSPNSIAELRAPVEMIPFVQGIEFLIKISNEKLTKS